MSMNYCVEDIVILKGSYDGADLSGTMGKISKIRDGSYLIDFSIDKPSKEKLRGYLHNGNLGEEKKFFWVRECHIESILNATTTYQAVGGSVGKCAKSADENVLVSKKWNKKVVFGERVIDQTFVYMYPVCERVVNGSYKESTDKNTYQSDTVGIIKTGRTFGVELECVNRSIRSTIKQKSNDYFFIPKTMERKGDGSLRGITTDEFVTPILKGAVGEEYLKNVCKTLTDIGYYTNKSCGTHVHIGIPEAKDLRREKTVNAKLAILLEFYTKIEDTIRQLIPKTRRENGYCKKLVGNNLSEKDFEEKQYLKSKRLDEFWYNRKGLDLRRAKGGEARNRYTGINFNPIWRRGAIEIRYNHGTLDYGEILHWTAFHSAIVEAIMSGMVRQKDVEELSLSDDYKDNLLRIFSLIESFISEDTKKEMLGRYKKYISVDLEDTDDSEEEDDDSDYNW